MSFSVWLGVFILAAGAFVFSLVKKIKKLMFSSIAVMVISGFFLLSTLLLVAAM